MSYENWRSQFRSAEQAGKAAYNEMQRYKRELEEAQPAPVAVPEGWRLVPVEPDGKQIKAMCAAQLSPSMYHVYAAAVNTAPPAPAVDGHAWPHGDGAVSGKPWYSVYQPEAAPAVDELEGWDPIEQAPKDGTDIIAIEARPVASFMPHCVKDLRVVRWDQGGPTDLEPGWFDDEEQEMLPTHYRLPPRLRAQQQGGNP